MNDAADKKKIFSFDLSVPPVVVSGLKVVGGKFVGKVARGVVGASVSLGGSVGKVSMGGLTVGESVASVGFDGGFVVGGTVTGGIVVGGSVS